MASLLPLISEILPMVMPASTHITRAKELQPAHTAAQGVVVTKSAVVDRCSKMCASRGSFPNEIHLVFSQPLQYLPLRGILQCCSYSKSILVLTAHANSVSSIRHNSEHDAIIYAVSGTGILTVKKGFEDELQRHELRPGDFAFVPAWTEHQVRNETDSDVVWVVTQSGSHPVGAVLADWGGDETTADS